jgi:hypothetical protein
MIYRKMIRERERDRKEGVLMLLYSYYRDVAGVFIVYGKAK